jgi:hypothetical protein
MDARFDAGRRRQEERDRDLQAIAEDDRLARSGQVLSASASSAGLPDEPIRQAHFGG